MERGNQLTKKLKAFHAAPRDRFQLLKNKVLTDEEFILFEFGIAIADWDEKHHPDTYGSFRATDNQIGLMLNWSASKVNRNKNGLLKKRFFMERADRRFEIKDFYRYEIKSAYQLAKNENSNLQNDIAKMKSEFPKLQDSFAKMQTETTKESGTIEAQEIANLQDTHSKSDLVSSKVKFNVLRSDEEYQKIMEEGNYTMLTIDDMKWIDQNI